MATTAAQRETIARNIMKKGKGIVCIPNPRAPNVDAILVKCANYHPTNPNLVEVWKEFTGDNANSTFLP